MNADYVALRKEIEREKRLRLALEDNKASPVANSAFIKIQQDDLESIETVRARYLGLLEYTELLQDEYRAIVRSRSWQLTRWYRSLGQLMYRLRRGTPPTRPKAPFDYGRDFRSPSESRLKINRAPTGHSAKAVSVRTAGAPKGVSERHKVDVCIVTTCRVPGGNTSSTLDEIRTFSEAGLSVLLVHLPLSASPRVSDRYEPYLDKLVHADDVERVDCRIMIARAPRVIMHDNFLKFASRVRCERAIFVINNSAYRPDGTPTFDWRGLRNRVDALDWPAKGIHPLGPAIRQEALAHDIGGLAEFDWGPTFPAQQLPFMPKAVIVQPYVIGRHGRDGAEKWLDDTSRLLGAYPADDPQIRVFILGGAENAIRVLGSIPGNWTVYPFGSLDVSEYLGRLDAFVYFPHQDLNEAFGRTIMEAMFSGVPCILPSRFEQTFGQSAFYCDPAEVRSVIARLADPTLDQIRGEFLEFVREEAVKAFDSSALFRRLPELEIGREQMNPRSISDDLQKFKLWVETGRTS